MKKERKKWSECEPDRNWFESKLNAKCKSGKRWQICSESSWKDSSVNAIVRNCIENNQANRWSFPLPLSGPPCQLAWIWTEAPSYVNPPEVRTLRYHFEIESSWFYCWYHNNYNLLRMRYIAQIAWLKTRSVYSSETIPHTNWAIQRSNRPRINTSTD